MVLKRAMARTLAPVRLPRGRLARRLLAWFLLFSLVPLVVTNAVGYRRSSSILQQLVERYLSAVAEAEAQHVRDRIDHAALMLQAIAAGNEFLSAAALRSRGLPAGQMGTVAGPAALERFLQAKLEDLEAFDALYVFAPDGQLISSVGDRADVVATVPPNRNATTLSVTLRHATLGVAEPQVRLAVPLRDNRGRVIAYLAGTAEPRGFRLLMQLPPHLAGYIETFILDEDGRPLFVSHQHSFVDYSAPLATPLAALPSGTIRQYRDRDGVPVIGSVQAIPGYMWRFVAELPVVDAFGDLRQLGGLSLLLEIVFIAVLVPSAWTVATDVVAPIGRLVEATRRIGRGDLSVRVSIPEGGEVGELGNAFNEMASDLAETTARVQELHEREIQRASQLATVGELASGVAHEIKNPVVGVSNGLDLVRRHVGNDPALTPIIDEMGRQLSRIQLTVQELLTFARPATPMLAPVRIDHLVERASRLIKPAADRAGVRIELYFAPDVPRFLADEEMLHQALVNLLMNALQATPAGGRITVTTELADGDLVLEVADTGRGIAKADRDAVFKPFYTTRHTGTGLGLPISREIAQRHGGNVTLVSEVGAGTTVTLSLPIRLPDSDADVRQTETP